MVTCSHLVIQSTTYIVILLILNKSKTSLSPALHLTSQAGERFNFSTIAQFSTIVYITSAFNFVHSNFIHLRVTHTVKSRLFIINFFSSTHE